MAVLDTESDAKPRLCLRVVVTVADSRTFVSAIQRVSRWFRASEGMVEVALLLKFTGKQPLVNPACFIVMFHCRISTSPGPDPAPAELDSVMTKPVTVLKGVVLDGFDPHDRVAVSDATILEDEDNSASSNSASAARNTHDATAHPENHSGCEHDSSDWSTTNSDSSDDNTSSNASY